MVDLEEFYFTDYCNCCDDLDIMDPLEIPCHHPWYCHHDKEEVEKLESEIALINHNIWLRGYVCAYERARLKELKNKKFNLVQQKLREFRRTNR